MIWHINYATNLLLCYESYGKREKVDDAGSHAVRVYECNRLITRYVYAYALTL